MSISVSALSTYVKELGVVYLKIKILQLNVSWHSGFLKSSLVLQSFLYCKLVNDKTRISIGIIYNCLKRFDQFANV